jgi:hypothetical protein
MQHLYGVQSSAITNVSLAELYFITTDDMVLSNKLQNAISAVSVVQT